MVHREKSCRKVSSMKWSRLLASCPPKTNSLYCCRLPLPLPLPLAAAEQMEKKKRVMNCAIVGNMFPCFIIPVCVLRIIYVYIYKIYNPREEVIVVVEEKKTMIKDCFEIKWRDQQKSCSVDGNFNDIYIYIYKHVKFVNECEESRSSSIK